MYLSKAAKVLILALDLSGLATNAFALIHVRRSFDISTHVFTLIFIDALVSTACCVLSSVVDVVSLSVNVDHTVAFCTFEFLASMLSSHLGASLTLLVASIRYVLTLKAAKNRQPSNFKVSLISITVFIVVAVSFLSYVIINAILDRPFSFLVETCTNSESLRPKRDISSLNVIALQMPIFFNLISLLVDLCLVKFLRKTILPQSSNAQQMELISTISGRITAGSFILVVFFLRNVCEVF
jgi:hypothetical protein